MTRSSQRQAAILSLLRLFPSAPRYEYTRRVKGDPNAIKTRLATAYAQRAARDESEVVRRWRLPRLKIVERKHG